MIDLLVHGDAAQCRAAAVDLEAQRRQVASTSLELGYLIERCRSTWIGEAAENCRRVLAGIRDEADELDRKLLTAVQALESFAAALDTVRAEMDRARELAMTSGLSVDGTAIHSVPAPWTAAGDLPALRPVGSPLPANSPYDSCFRITEAARDLEDAAHDALQRAAADIQSVSFLDEWLGKFGILPTGGVTGREWLSSAGLLSAGVAADYAARVKFGEFRPLVNGVRTFGSDLAWSQRFRPAFGTTGWRARPHLDLPYARWAGTSEMLGVAGAVYTGGLSALDRWRADADDPTIGGTERAARAATTGVATGAGAYGGAVVGGQVGGAIGTMICPGVGTVVGATVGGVVFGVAGSELGGWVGDQAKGVVGDVIGMAKFW